MGREWTLEQGYEAARLTALNMLATLKAHLSNLDRVRHVVKLLGMVNCMEEFTRISEVIHGATDLCAELWGDRGQCACSAVGMQRLHFGMAIKMEGIFEVSAPGRAHTYPP